MNNALTEPHEGATPLTWGKSFFWLALAVTCFHAAYTWTKIPAMGLFIVGYAVALVRLADQPTVRRAFYFGLATGYLGCGPQLWFFFNIFNVAGAILWLVLAFWVGLFTAIGCGCIRRWGWRRAAWLLPIIWTGLEYFRSELYYLKFSWLNVGYALPPALVTHWGMYGAGLLLFAVAAAYRVMRWPVATAGVVALTLGWAGSLPKVNSSRAPQTIPIVGVQLEFPPENVIPKVLDRALAKNTNAQIFVLSEYTLSGPVPDALKNWCRAHGRYLAVGGEAPAGATNYYDTAFVVGTNGEVVFQQGKCVPIQFFRDGLPAPAQRIWESPWGRIGFCVCYDLSYTRVTDELIRQGAQLLIVPTMDVEYWSRHEHELHTRVAPLRAAEYGVPIFRLASSGISQAVDAGGGVVAEAPMPGSGAVLAATMRLPERGALPFDRWLAPVCAGLAAVVTAQLLALTLIRRVRPPRAGGGQKT